MDLSLHLQTAHAALWLAAQETIGVLVETLYEKRGCFCNPQSNAPRTQHVCVPLKQLAMQFHRQSVIPLMPVKLTDADMATLISPRLAREHRFVLERVLLERRFEAFWSSPDVTKITSSHCLLCGAAIPAAGLCHHIHEDHVCAHFMITYFQKQLLPSFLQQQTRDFQCDSCQQIYNMPLTDDTAVADPARAVLTSTHLRANCPCILQTSILFASALHGCVEPGPTGRAGSSTGSGGLQQCDSGDRQDPQSRTRSAPSQTTTRSKKARTNRSSRVQVAGPEDSGDAQNHGHRPYSPRPGSSESQAKRQFHALFQQGAIRHSSQDATGSRAVAHSDGPEDGQHGDLAAANPSDDHHAERPSDPGDGCVEIPEGGGAVPDDSSQPDHSGGLLMAFPAVVPPEAAECDFDQKGHQHEADVGDVHGTHRAFQEPDGHPEISCTSGSTGLQDRPLASDPAHAHGRSLRPHEPSLFQQCLVSTWNPTTATSPDTKSVGAGSEGPDGQRTWQRQGQTEGQSADSIHGEAGDPLTWDHLELVDGLLALQLANSSNLCYANAGFYCVVWMMLCVQPFDMTFWGRHFKALTSFFMISTSPASFETTDWFGEILKCWGARIPQPLEQQQDSTEFLHFLLQWLDSSLFHMGWIHGKR